jgi:transglutaminase-like putative cysteine protease
MTVTQRVHPSPDSPARARRSGRRWHRRLQRFFARGDLSGLMIALGLMLVTALAVRAAGWTGGLDTLSVVSVCAVGLGVVLARSQYSELFALIVSALYGAVIVGGISAAMLVEDGSLRSRAFTLAEQLTTWFAGALAGEQAAHDDVAFVVFLAVLFWFLGHNAAWHIFRVDQFGSRVGRVIAPTGLVLLTNQFYYRGDKPLDIYLVAFVLLSLLLLIHSHIEQREFDWVMRRVDFPNYIRRVFFQAGGVLALIIVIAAWSAPAGPDDKDLERLSEMLAKNPLAEVNELINRLFSSLESEGIATADFYGGEQLQLSGAVQLGDDPVMAVEVPPGPRYYWRSTVYDSYDFGKWRWRHIRTITAYTDSGTLHLNIGPMLPGARLNVSQRFTLLMSASRLVYAAPQPVMLGLPVEVDLDCVNDFGQTCVNKNQPSDIAIIRARNPLRAGDSYSVTSAISTATAAQLREAGTDYPTWVLRLYLQGASSVPYTVQDLTTQIVNQANAQTPYDKAKAIERWLRVNIAYNEAIPAPPANRDPIEWFLFEQREGYCNYYATAMVLMLRAQGVPARMAAGFAQGTWDPQREAFLVRERDAHTWVEVYFPGYGWVEFEPTADEAPIERDENQVPEIAAATPTPWPTPTPIPATPTLTPTVPPPTNALGMDQTPTATGIQGAPFIPATPTPGATVAPTATDPPPPDVTRVDTNGDENVLKTILTTLGIFALVVVGVILAVAFAIWYIEYRGLGGLNVIQKAYARMGIYGRWLGLSFEQSATPIERRHYLIDEIPEGEQPISIITHAYMHDRYASPGTAAADGDEHHARDAWHEARRVFVRRKLARVFRRGKRA